MSLRRTPVKSLFKIVLALMLGWVLINLSSTQQAQARSGSILALIAPPDSGDSAELPYPIHDRRYDFYTNPYWYHNPFDLNDPSTVRQTVEYNPVTGKFEINERLGDRFFRDPNTLSFEDFMEQEAERSNRQYWEQRSNAVDLVGRSEGIQLAGEDSKLDELFGPGGVDIRPRGNIELIFGGSFQNIQNPTLPERARKQGGFDFDMNINMSVIGKIGDKLELTTQYNTQATFDFENQVKIEYKGDEDQIIQSIEAGNVSFPLRSSLITGSQSLFGLKSELKFGRLTVTSVVSQQKSNKENVRIEGGAQTKDFKLYADEYDENRHFFLAHYFRDNYEKAMASVPFINSPAYITKVEVWVTNSTGITENTRDVVGFMDLGETDHIYNSNWNVSGSAKYPGNNANNLYNTLVNNSGARAISSVNNVLTNSLNLDPITDFEKTRAKKLDPSQYTVYPKRGFISLNQQLKPDEVLAVAYEYTLQGKTYQVGEFSENIPFDPNIQNVLFLKMLKSTSARPRLPIWDLMMKNIYSLGAFQISQEDFRLDVLYTDPGGGKKRYIPAGENINGIPLIKLLGLDRLNQLGDPSPDGIFDFVVDQGVDITINPRTGKILFPVLEPFGADLREQFLPSEQTLANNFVYDILYDSTKTFAEQFPQFNRYTIEGTYKSSISSEIYLGAFNIPRGSVTVTAGGQQLRENVDYTIDYNLGRVKILNDGLLQSGVPININYENSALFNFQTKTLYGNRFDYWINDNFTIGATHMHLSERPYTQKVNLGDDPISNDIFGVDGNYSTELPLITRLVDRLPFFKTEANSSLALSGEVAHFRPGVSRAVINKDDNGDKNGIIYLDDFEGSESSYDLKFPSNAWNLASTPQGAVGVNGQELFPEARRFNDLSYNYNRAKLLWYALDPVFQDNNSSTPESITPAMQSNHYVRIIDEEEIFETDNPNPLSRLATFDLRYLPTQRGPYNFETTSSDVSAGLENDGSGRLAMPETRWGGIQRSLETNDFEAANIEFIDFWLMDPFDNLGGSNSNPGEMYINIGNVSEDVLKDSRNFFENGLPTPNSLVETDTTTWSRIPLTQAITNSFDNEESVLKNQDLGYDGFDDDGERQKRSQYLSSVQALVNPDVFNAIQEDPSADNFIDYLDPAYENNTSLSILERYNNFDGSQGNTAAGLQQDEFSHGSNVPNSEDLNRDNTLNETEEYFQYRIPIFPGMDVSNNEFITDTRTVTYDNWRDGNVPADDITWYHFKIPLDEYQARVGGIQDFRSIRFIRMFLTEFDAPVVMRFAKLELVRNQWRRYKFDLTSPWEQLNNDDFNDTYFNVSSVSVEENSTKDPIPYRIPPGVEREELAVANQSQPFLQNEQSLSMEVCGLADGEARAIYKTLNFDVRRYKKMQLFLHAESFNGNLPSVPLQDGDLEAFIRLGSDFTENFYEYAIPLKVTNPDDLTGTTDQEREAVWPDENLMEIILDSLVAVKRSRNAQDISAITEYKVDIGGGKSITLIGNPNLGDVKVAMIGLRNVIEPGVNGDDLCAEVWVNELRLKGIDERGGFAGLARADLQIADLGTMNFALSGHTKNYGQLEQQIDERFQDNFLQYDASTSLELGKLLPEKLKLRIPMYAGISQSYSRPEYDPYDYDVKLDDKLATLQGDERKEYLSQVQDFTSIKSLNFTNVKREKSGKGKPKPWDISNLNASYAYTEIFKSNPVIAQDLVKKRRLGLAYNYNIQAKYIEPFKKLIGNSKLLKPIKEINFNPIPSQISFRNEFNRQYGELILRDIYGDANIDTSFNKFFLWDRYYDVRFDLTRSLKLDFSAVNTAAIDEPEGKIDTPDERDSVWQNIKDFGRNKNYRHNMSLNYTAPFSKISFLNWITARATYATDYAWEAARLNLDSLGNTINNSQSIRLNGDLNLKNLYTKVGFIKRYEQSKNKRSRSSTKTPARNTEDKVGETEDAEEKKVKKEGELGPVVGGIVDVVTMVKRLSLNYTETSTTTLPGFNRTTNLLGQDAGFNAPGWDFVFGYQPDQEWLDRELADKGYLVTAKSMNTPLAQTYSQNWDLKINVEPFNEMRLDITFKRNYSENHTEFFRFDDSLGSFVHQNPIDFGSYSISYYALGTAFAEVDTSTNLSSTFEQFSAYRQEISAQLGNQNPYSNGIFTGLNDTIYPEYREGYGPYAQQTVLPAFLAAYSGKDLNATPFNILKAIPKPNWRFTWNGLSKVKPLSDIFSQVKLSHGYAATLTVNEFRTNFNYVDSLGNPSGIDSISGNFYPVYSIPQVTLNEQLLPLLGIDVTLRNSMTAKFEWKKTRNVSVSLVDYQLIETKSTEFTLGAGYRLKGLTLPFKRKGKKMHLENDLNFKFDFSFRDDKTTNYQIDQNTAIPTRGNKTISISPSVDYVVNDRLNVRLFFDRRQTIPATSSSYPVTNTEAGVAVRFTLAE